MSETQFDTIGNHIALKEGYVGLKGMEAVYRYLVDKYSWLPKEVRNLTHDDLHMLLAGYEEKGTTDWD